MIYIFHGENLSFSRDQIIRIQKIGNFESEIELRIEDTDPQQLSDALSSFDFFENPPFVILNISNVGRSGVTDFIDVIKKAPKESTLVILSSRELSKANVFIKAASELKAKVLFSKKVLESNIFNFIDNVFSGKRNISYKNLAELINDGQDPIYILTMMEYALRNIANVKFNSPLVNKMNPFTRIKAVNQARLYSEESIRRLYEFFYHVDLDSKIGEINQNILIPLCVEKILSEATS